MLILDRGFPPGYQQNVQDAVAAIRNNPNRGQLPRDFKQGLDVVLNGLQAFPYPTIVSRSAMIGFDDRIDGPYAYTGGVCIWLCKRLFDAGQDRVNAALLHELVHVLCGWELDAEVFENLLFNGHGATIPDKGDIDAFARKNWTGRWVCVDNEVIPRVVKNLWGNVIVNLDKSFFQNFD